jgi:hypothetical protein
MKALENALLLAVLAPVCLFAQSPATHSRVQPDASRLALTQGVGLQATGDSALGGGADYRVLFGVDGVRFEPALSRTCPETQHLRLRVASVRRGSTVVLPTPLRTLPRCEATTVCYPHADGVTERYEVRPDAVALSWTFADCPAGAGDLVVRYAVDTSLGAPAVEARGHVFGGEHGGVCIGGVTGIDARGRTIAGATAWVDGGLELSLPAEFVANASYPLVLDPTIGTVVPVSSSLSWADGEPDVAFDIATSHYLVVWERTFSATNVDIRGQRVSAAGSLVGGTIFFGSNGVAGKPRVANSNQLDRFGVVWIQQVGTTSSIQFQTVDVGNSTLSTPVVVATTTATPFPTADVGCATNAVGAGTGFFIVYDDDNNHQIRGFMVAFDAQGTMWTSGGNLMSNPLFTSLEEPAIARAAAQLGSGPPYAQRDFGFVVKQRNVLNNSSSILFRIVGLQTSGTVSTWGGSEIVVATSSSNNLGRPDVDGYDGRWVIAYERLGSGLTYDAVIAASVTWDPNAFTATLGNSTTIGGSSLFRATRPTVGYAAGRSWIGHRYVVASTSTTTLRVLAVDTDTCTACNDSFSVPYSGGDRIVVGTKTSGGLVNDTTSFAVFDDSFDDVAGQRLVHYGSSGTYQDLGGSCGAAGNLAWNHPPGIGSPLQCQLSGMTTTSIAAVFNLSPPTTAVPCGPCHWTPFSATLGTPILFGIATVEFVVPCIPSLAGAQFEAQWTVVDLVQAPCSVFPGIVLSNRSLVTFGP